MAGIGLLPLMEPLTDPKAADTRKSASALLVLL